MNRRHLLFIALPVAASLAVFVACSTSHDAFTAIPVPPPDGRVLADARLDTTSQPDAPRPTCTMVDLAPGTGKKFCELPGTDATALQVPPEFCIREYTTTPIIEARVMRFAPNGDLFLAAPSMSTPGGAGDGPGAILVLPDDDGDGRADAVLTFAGGSPRNGSSACSALEGDAKNLACVHGLLFSGGYVYFTRSDEVRRLPYTAGARSSASATGELVANLGGKDNPQVRWTHTLEQTKDGTIYVSRGRFDASDCSTGQMKVGAVFALNVGGAASLPVTPSVMADGFRNPMYLRCSPGSCGDCYASELSGDGWDGVGGREKLALLDTKGESWGYPCCVQRNVPAPNATADCTNVGRELVGIPLHDTPFGFDFERGTFPEPYKHGVFAALHGAVTSFGGSGVVWLKTDSVSLRPTGEATMFVQGFGRPTGRATDVAFAPDGRMFIADDTSGKIYWVAPRTLAAPK